MKYLLQGQLVKLAKEINGLNPLRDMTAMVALVMAPLLPRIRAGSGKGEENMGGSINNYCRIDCIMGTDHRHLMK